MTKRAWVSYCRHRVCLYIRDFFLFFLLFFLSPRVTSWGIVVIKQRNLMQNTCRCLVFPHIRFFLWLGARCLVWLNHSDNRRNYAPYKCAFWRLLPSISLRPLTAPHPPHLPATLGVLFQTTATVLGTDMVVSAGGTGAALSPWKEGDKRK